MSDSDENEIGTKNQLILGPFCSLSFSETSVTDNLERSLPFSMWRHSTTELYHQSVRPTCSMCHRYPYGPFAECIRGNRRGRLPNACVVGISRGNKEKNPFGFEQIHSTPSCERFSVIAKQMSRQTQFKYDELMMEIKMWGTRRQCISQKCLMNHRYPKGPCAEYSRRRCAWQRS